MTKRRMFGCALLTSAIFTVLDGLVHYAYEPLEIYYYPFHFLGIESALINYAISKFLSSTILLFALFYLFAKTNVKPYVRALSTTVLIVTLLELRYVISGRYSTTWHVLNVMNHSVTLLAALIVVERIVPDRRAG